ncbi:MAG: type II toxin-antitoxin system VapC family toxin [Nanoarchaeota archaeon]
MIGLDTDTIIDIFKDDFKLSELIKSLEEDLCSTIINYQELIFGLDFNNKKHLEEGEYYDSLFDKIILLNLDKDACKKTNEIIRNLLAKGNPIGEFDCMIAGIFLKNGVNKIVTRNVKHFEKVPGLKVISY